MTAPDTSRRIPFRIPLSLFAFAVLLARVPVPAAAQNAQGQWDVTQAIQSEKFVKPPAAIAEAALAPRWLNVTLSDASPDRKLFLNEVSDGPVTMDVFSKPFHELGGLFIDFAANRNRTLTIRNIVGIEVISGADGSKVQVQIPPGARVSNATWSPDGRSIAFFAHTPTATHIWLADPATGRSRQLTRSPVLATLVTGFQWVQNGKAIATVLIPAPRAATPVKPASPPGPQVKLAEESDKNRLRTYASLMATPYDGDLLEWHATGQLALIDVASRAVKTVGKPDMIRSVDPSPDGMYVRVSRMVRPFSYMVPVSNFGSVDEIWDLNGKVMLKLGEEKLNLGVDTARAVTAPGAGGETPQQSGRRELAWRVDGQGLTFLEQEPAPPGADTAQAPAEGLGQGQQRARRKDRVMQWLAPFDSASLKVVYESDTRMSGHRFSPDMKIVFLSERTGQNVHEYAVRLSDPAKKLTLARYRSEDFYANPGTIVMAQGGMGGGAPLGGGRGGGGAGGGRTVLLSADGAHVFFYGTQYDKNPEQVGPKNFLDKVNIDDSSRKTRVYESDNNGVYERILTIQDADAARFIVSRESPTSVPQSFLRRGGQLTQLTKNTDYTPDLTRAPKESFVVERPDGFKFKVNVTLPPGYQQGTKLPAMFWFYPREYAGQEEYDRGARTFNKNSFPNFGTRSLQFLVRLGYAVVEPDAPIIGPAGQWNVNYENDLRNNLSAVIDEVERRGLVDRTRIGIGGHSYGAFSTVNAMVHTPFFKAGIAGDGNYNRTLTPLDFQSERRTLWDARDVYLAMSPLLYANNLTGALLMYHGLHDQNVGTDPINSPRLFHALNGLGKTTSMYLYPYEDHGPATLETQLDLWARWAAWLDKYVKNPQKAEQKVTTDGAAGGR
jgi:dipeptidyl aminopeptidase/acylaminoacyl peptidase